MTTQQLTTALPPKTANPTENNEDRRFYTALTGSNYLKLEQESMARGLKPYALSKLVLTLFLQGEMIALSDLPEDVATKIRGYMQSKQRGNLEVKEVK